LILHFIACFFLAFLYCNTFFVKGIQKKEKNMYYFLEDLLKFSENID